MYRAYFRKNDMEEPPLIDDGDEDKETPAHVIQNSNSKRKRMKVTLRPDFTDMEYGQTGYRFIAS